MSSSQGKSAARAAARNTRAPMPATLSALDALDVDTLAFLLAEDERPLQGAAGLLDWRMCGWLTQQLLAGTIKGARGERVLTWPASRIAVPRVIIHGAGPAKGVVDALPSLLTELSDALEKTRCKSVALAASCPADALQKALGDAPASLQDKVRVLFSEAA